MYAKTTSGQAKPVVDIEMRPVDAFKMQTVFKTGGAVIAEMQLLQKDGPIFWRWSSECISLWKVTTHANVDKALMLALALIRVEVHASKKR